jgi:uncharacterized protein YoaH (UPF0181 family)
MFPMKSPEALKMIVEMAKEGDKEAQRYLRHYYSLRVYTHEEVERINQGIAEGVPHGQAIKQLNGEEVLRCKTGIVDVTPPSAELHGTREMTGSVSAPTAHTEGESGSERIE